MNRKKSLLVFAGLFVLVFLAGLASATTLANWNFEAENLVPSTDITSSAVLSVNNADGTQNFTAGNPSTGNALHYDNWDAGDYFEVTINTLGYKDLVLRFDEMKSSTGPTEFKMQYSADGTNFTDLASSTTNTSASFLAHTFGFSSVTGLNNISNAKFRIFSTQNASSTVGTWRVDNLAVEGTSLTAPPVVNWENNFCVFDDGEANNPGNLDVTIEDISVTGFGDDNEFLPFDKVEVEVSIENNGNDDVRDIDLEWGLYDNEADEWVIEVDKEDDYDIDKDDDETVTFSFTIDEDMDIDLEDLDDGSHYVLYVRATGEVDNADDDPTCDADSDTMEFVLEKDFVIVKDIEVPESASCSLQVSADVWNIGSRNQDSVSVKIFNKDLGINKLVEVGDIDSFESEALEETLTIPSNAKSQSYLLTFEVYDEDDDIYQNDYDDQDAKFTKAVQVSCSGGGSQTGGDSEGSVLVSAEVESGGEAGKPLVIKAILTNSGSKSAKFLLNAAGYSSWAESAKAVPESLTLDAGKSASVLLTFNVNKDASGDNTFDLEVVSENELVAVQPVSISISESKGGFKLGGNWYIWLIAALNLVLIVIIISVAMKVAKRK
ncbi:putative S-layer protein [Candidatus Pacearchaeota archaeon]|nr:putative S-layer protein [Candidatus Pacearchaeota archaeon]